MPPQRDCGPSAPCLRNPRRHACGPSAPRTLAGGMSSERAFEQREGKYASVLSNWIMLHLPMVFHGPSHKLGNHCGVAGVQFGFRQNLGTPGWMSVGCPNADIAVFGSERSVGTKVLGNWSLVTIFFASNLLFLYPMDGGESRGVGGPSSSSLCLSSLVTCPIMSRTPAYPFNNVNRAAVSSNSPSKASSNPRMAPYPQQGASTPMSSTANLLSPTSRGPPPGVQATLSPNRGPPGPPQSLRSVGSASSLNSVCSQVILSASCLV